MIFISGHLGPIELPGLYLANRSGSRIVAPMETVGDPALQGWFERTRSSFGVRIVSLREARRELAAALKRGEHVGLVADRDVSGGGLEVPFFGAPAPIPIGPAFLAVDAGAPIYMAGDLANGPADLPRAGSTRSRSRPRARAEPASRRRSRRRPSPSSG